MEQNFNKNFITFVYLEGFEILKIFTTVSMNVIILRYVTPSVLLPIVHNTRRHWPQSWTRRLITAFAAVHLSLLL